jgi:IS5 family transposase
LVPEPEAVVEPVVGNLKCGHRMNCNYLAFTPGDAINPILAAVGYNFRVIFEWITKLLSKICVTWVF